MPASSLGLMEARKLMEAQMIRDALSRTGNNRLATARVLGMHKSTLFRKIKTLGIEMPREDGRGRGKRKG